MLIGYTPKHIPITLRNTTQYLPTYPQTPQNLAPFQKVNRGVKPFKNGLSGIFLRNLVRQIVRRLPDQQMKNKKKTEALRQLMNNFKVDGLIRALTRQL